MQIGFLVLFRTSKTEFVLKFVVGFSDQAETENGQQQTHRRGWPAVPVPVRSLWGVLCVEGHRDGQELRQREDLPGKEVTNLSGNIGVEI